MHLPTQLVFLFISNILCVLLIPSFAWKGLEQDYYSIIKSNVELEYCNNMAEEKCDALDQHMFAYLCKMSCDVGWKLRCTDDSLLGRIYFCHPVQLCPPGFYRQILVDRNTPTVISQLKQCPPGFYKPLKTDCYVQCREQLSTPDNVVLYSPGNATTAKIVYCNYMKFYINLSHKTIIELPLYTPTFCVNWKELGQENYPCPDGQYPLPNATCVFPCNTGYIRDDTNLEFTCKPSNRKDAASTESSISKADSPRKMSMNAASPNRESDEGDKGERPNIQISVILGAFSGACMLVLFGCVMVYYLHAKRLQARDPEYETVPLTDIRVGCAPTCGNRSSSCSSSSSRISSENDRTTKTTQNIYGNVYKFESSKHITVNVKHSKDSLSEQDLPEQILLREHDHRMPEDRLLEQERLPEEVRTLPKCALVKDHQPVQEENEDIKMLRLKSSESDGNVQDQTL